MMQKFEVAGDKWDSISAHLHAAVLTARAAISSIPDNVELEEEFELVNSASASACRIAEEIMALEAVTARECEIKKMAAVWLDGTYPQ